MWWDFGAGDCSGEHRAPGNLKHGLGFDECDHSVSHVMVRYQPHGRGLDHASPGATQH